MFCLFLLEILGVVSVVRGFYQPKVKGKAFGPAKLLNLTVAWPRYVCKKINEEVKRRDNPFYKGRFLNRHAKWRGPLVLSISTRL